MKHFHPDAIKCPFCRIEELESAGRECLLALKASHETLNGAIEMDVVEELSCDTMNAAHRGSYECIRKYSHLFGS